MNKEKKFGVNYSLVEDKLTGKGGYYAKAVHIGTYSTQDLVNEIVGMGSTLTEVDIDATLTFLKRAIKKIILHGGKIKLEGLCTFYASLSGRFENKNETFNKSVHKIKIKSRMDQNFVTDLANNAKMVQVKKPESRPELDTIIDLKSDLENTQMTVGRLARVRGDKLYFDPAQEDEGIFFITEQTGQETKIEFNEKPSATNMIFLVPSIDTGGEKVFVEIRSRMYGKTLKMGRTSQPLELTA